jgi:hypothetical protein
MQVPGPLGWGKLGVVLTVWLLVLCLFGGLSLATKAWVSPVSRDRQDQCEALNYTNPAKNEGKVFEIQNTWSNAGYLLAGILILFCSSKPLGLAVGFQLCVLAIFSGLYHATLQNESSHTIDAQMLDVAGIYFVLWSLIIYGLQCVFLRRRLFASVGSPFLTTACELLGAAFAMVMGYVMASTRKDVCLFDSTTATFVFVATLIVITVYQMCRLGFNWRVASNPLQIFWPGPKQSNTDRLTRAYFWGFVSFGVPAVFFRLNDGHNRLLCKPDGMLGFLQAHAMWHVLGAAVLLVGYDFFAWSSRSLEFDDFAVFGGGTPAVRPWYPSTVAAILAAVFGAFFLVAALLKLDFVYNVPNPPGDPSRCVLTGVLIGVTFLLGAGLTAVLRMAGVLGKDS